MPETVFILLIYTVLSQTLGGGSYYYFHFKESGPDQVSSLLRSLKSSPGCEARMLTIVPDCPQSHLEATDKWEKEAGFM